MPIVKETVLGKVVLEVQYRRVSSLDDLVPHHNLVHNLVVKGGRRGEGKGWRRGRRGVEREE